MNNQFDRQEKSVAVAINLTLLTVFQTDGIICHKR
jgi:hypothetical protein